MLAAFVFPASVGGQSRSAEWEVGVHAGALRIDDDVARRFSSAMGPVVAATAAWRPSERAFFEIEAWRWAGDAPADPLFDPPEGGEGDGDGLDLWGAGLSLGVSPLAGSRRVDPHLLFGVETVRGNDDEERGAVFVAGGGFRAGLARRWIARVDLRNHFMTIDEDEVDGVVTGRDASLWELRAGLGVRLGGGS